MAKQMTAEDKKWRRQADAELLKRYAELSLNAQESMPQNQNFESRMN